VALYFDTGTGDASRICVWHAEEPVDALAALAAIPPAAPPTGTTARQKERLTVQLLLRRVFAGGTTPPLQYDSYGRPTLPTTGLSISISHTGPFVGIMLSPRSRCGLDLEVIHPRIRHIAPRFLSDEEQRFAGTDPSLLSLYVLWGAKEVLYKIHGSKGLLFREHIAVEPFAPGAAGKVQAHLLANGVRTSFSVHYQKEGGLLLTYAVPPENYPG
jgi:4'-phosphopantetheinyl transferase